MRMHLLVGKLPMMDYCGARLERRLPEADTFALLFAQLDGVQRVNRVAVDAFNTPRLLTRSGRQLRLELTDTPIFVTAKS